MTLFSTDDSILKIFFIIPDQEANNTNNQEKPTLISYDGVQDRPVACIFH